MYHIGTDKRQVQSAELICTGMTKLMTQIDYKEISVAQLAEVSGVGRATFYRLFDDKADVVRFQMESILENLIEKLSPDSSPMVFLTGLFEMWLAQKAVFISLLKSGLYDDFQAILCLFVEKRLEFIKHEHYMSDHDWKYFVHIRTAMLLSALRLAIVDYPGDTADVILATVNRLFGEQPPITKDMPTQ